jgi:hypothetical protein
VAEVGQPKKLDFWMKHKELLMRTLLRTKTWLTLVVIAALALSSSAVLAHEDREKGGYQFVVGFMNEPAHEGFENAVSFRVTKPAPAETHSHEEGAEHEEVEMVPVEGLESTVQVEVTHLPTGVSKTLPLRSVWSDPGHYAADLIPTAPGKYRFRFFGTLEGTELDESFESGPDTFSEIQSAEVLQFPEPLPSVREVESAVRGAQSAAQEAQDAASSASSAASSASTLAIIGIVLGAVGVVSGIGGVAMGMRKR